MKGPEMKILFAVCVAFVGSAVQAAVFDDVRLEGETSPRIASPRGAALFTSGAEFVSPAGDAPADGAAAVFEKRFENGGQVLRATLAARLPTAPTANILPATTN